MVMEQHPVATYDDDGFYQRYQHHTAPRTATSINNLSIAEYGYVFDTMMDLLHANLLCGSHESIPTQSDPISITPDSSTLPPAYVYEYFDDYRYGGSFFRGDRHADDANEPSHPRQLHGVARFADKIHLDSRKLPAYLIESIDWPPAVTALKQEYEQMRADYQQLISTHKEYHAIPEAASHAMEERCEDFITRLQKALSPEQLPEITLHFRNGTHATIANQENFLPGQTEASTGLILFQFSNPQYIVTDLQKVPLAYADFSVNAISAESILTDVLQSLMDQASPDGSAFAQTLQQFRKQLKTHVHDHARDLQMTLAFHRIIDMAYPRAYEDTAHLMRLCDVPPELPSIETPQETAVLLYAASRRVSRDDVGEKDLDQAIAALAQSVSTSPDMASAKTTLDAAQEIGTLETVASAHHLDAISNMLSLINTQKPPPGIRPTPPSSSIQL